MYLKYVKLIKWLSFLGDGGLKTFTKNRYDKKGVVDPGRDRVTGPLSTSVGYKSHLSRSPKDMYPTVWVLSKFDQSYW